MVMSPAELNALLQKNPQLRVSQPGKKAAVSQVNAQLLSDASREKTAKYWNHKVFIQERGISIQHSDPELGAILEKYDSIKEYHRKGELDMLLRTGAISGLERQVTLVIQDAFEYGDEHIGSIVYKADFVYKDAAGITVVEDVKAFDQNTGRFRTTKDFDLKWKLLKFRYPDYKFVLY